MPDTLLERLLAGTVRDETLTRRAVAFVLSGEDPEVIKTIRQRQPIGRGHAPTMGYEETYDALAWLVALGDPGALVRFARIQWVAMPGRSLVLGDRTWPEALWFEAWLGFLDNYFRYPPRNRPPLLTCEHLVAMLASDGQTGELLVRAALEVKPGPQHWAVRHHVDTLSIIPGYGRLLAQYALLIRAWFAKAPALERVYVLELMRKCECDPELFLPELIEFATGPARTVREAAESLLVRIKGSARAELERVAREGDTAQRAHAFQLLAKFYVQEAGDFLRQFEKERMPLVAREALEKALDCAGRAEPRPFALPPAVVETNVPLSEAAREAFRQLAAVHSRRCVDLGLPDMQLSVDGVERLIFLLETLVAPPFEEAPCPLLGLTDQVAFSSCAQFVDSTDIELVHVVRLLLLNRGIQGLAKRSEFPVFLGPAGELLQRFRRRRPFDLRQLARVLNAVGVDERGILWSMRDEFTDCFLDWDSALVGPFLLDHVPLLERLLRERPLASYGTATVRFYRMLQHLPEIPPSLVDGLWRLATASSAERDYARQVLEKLPDLEARMRKALRGGSAGMRASVALWFAERGTASAVPAIRKALDAEKQEHARQAMMSALDRLGAPCEAVVDRDRLLFESAAIVTKGIPAALGWFPFNQMPPVHWTDSGEAVPPAILKRLLIENHKLASPEPGPILRRTCAEFRSDDRDALGQFVLDVWVGRDLGAKAPVPAPPSLAQAALLALAAATVQKFFAQYPQFAQFARFAPTGLSSQSSPAFDNPTSTATKDKGILAVAAACAGEGAVAKVSAYLKHWYGYRPAQCKALLGILPWLESPAATQLLLATARRFRTRTIQEEAERLSREMAQRRGWSMDQLGDRTIPDAGFDRDGSLQLPLGSRTLTLRLTPQLDAELVTAEGKSLKSFPEASAKDDEALHKAAKSDFTQARGTLRTVIAQQTQRLYEALCTERVWAFSELREHLFEHPIAGLLCRRLVWQAADGTFRPLGDGTLTNARDGQVELDGADPVRLAYFPADADAWRRHLADYEIVPLFPQLDRPLHIPTDLNASALADFCGYAVAFFRLKGLATKFGYRPAPVIDGPVFMAYLKRIPGLDMDLELEFSGMELPGKDQPVFLVELRFQRDETPLRLAELPRVLLSESWHDLKTIADAGTGYDADWESKRL